MRKDFYQKARDSVMEDNDKILYEWTLNEAQWKRSVLPLRRLDIKRDKSQIKVGIITALVVVFFFVIFHILQPNSNPRFIDVVLLYLGLVGILFLAFIAPMALWSYCYSRKKIRIIENPSKRAFFMTDEGVFNGREYCACVKRYRISEKETKIELFFVEYSHVTNRGIPVSPVKAWGDFIYNEKDKLPIFTILAQWEGRFDYFKPDSAEDKKRLYEYLESQHWEYKPLPLKSCDTLVMENGKWHIVQIKK
jgi:hypothetical protein